MWLLDSPDESEADPCLEMWWPILLSSPDVVTVKAPSETPAVASIGNFPPIDFEFFVLTASVFSAAHAKGAAVRNENYFETRALWMPSDFLLLLARLCRPQFLTEKLNIDR